MKRFLILLFVLSAVKYVSSQQWCFEYPCEKNEYAHFMTGDKSLHYNYVLGSLYVNDSNLPSAIALCVSETGEYKDRFFNENFMKVSFVTALGLNDGNVFVAAACSDNQEEYVYEKLWIAVLDSNLDVLSEKIMEIDEPYISYGLSAQALLNDDSEIVLVTIVTDSIPLHTIIEYDFSFYKFDTCCNLLKQSCLENPSYHSEITDFTKVPNADYYAMFSNGMHITGVETVSYIDDDLNYLSTNVIDNMTNYPNNILPMFVSVDYWYDENHFLMSAMSAHTEGINDWHPVVIKMDKDMNIQKSLSFERVDTTDYVSQYRSMACVNSDKIYISTFWQNSSDLEFYPNTATVFLINDKLDLLGRKNFESDAFIDILYIQPTFDEGCIIQACKIYNTHRVPLICKLKSEDFETYANILDHEDGIESCSFPNPVSSVLNINVKEFSNAKAHIVVVDVLGRRYMDKELCLDGDLLTLDVSLFVDGTYFYELIIDEKYVLKEKFIKR